MTTRPGELHHVWYVAYGSNLSADRFRCYLRGGTPPGSRRTYPGCRDRTEPARTVALQIRGRLAFTGVSTTWGGGTAVFDPAGDDEVAAAAYLLRTGQLADVLAQEMRRAPDVDLDLAGLERRGRCRLGPGRYETVVRVGTLDHIPLLTLTSDSLAAAPVTTPTEAYLRTMEDGLRDTHGWDAERIRTYLAAIPWAA